MTLPDETDHYQAREDLGFLRMLRRTSQGNIENSLKSSVKTRRKISHPSTVQPLRRDEPTHNTDLSLP